MAEFHQMVGVLLEEVNGSYYVGSGTENFYVTTVVGWGYHAICAVLGVALVFVSLELYRRRRLETAGDFIVFRAVEPVFQVLFTLGMGGVFQFMADVFGADTQMLFLAAGLAVGYYACRMLMMRTTRVFQPKAVIGLVVIAAVMAGSFLLVKLDAFGIVHYVPETAEVESVAVMRYFYAAANSRNFEYTDEEDIEQLRMIQLDAIENQAHPDENYTTGFHLIYTLTDGTTVERYYNNIAVDSYAGAKLEEFYSTPEYVLGMEESEYEDFVEDITYFWYEDTNLRAEEVKQYDMLGLLEAIAADCRNGNMAQDMYFHKGELRMGYLEFEYMVDSDRSNYVSVNIYDTSENTLRWLEDNGFEIYEGNVIGE